MAAAFDHLKSPEAVLKWPFDWFDWLGSGETISASEFTATAGITIDSHTFTTTNATVTLSGGSAGQVYTIKNKITTNQGNVDARSITIRVQERRVSEG